MISSSLLTRISAAHRRGALIVPVAVAAAVAGGCRGSATDGSQAGAPGGGPPAMAVEVLTLESQPIERTSEFVGAIRSRRSTRIQPQVEGFITRIAVRSGDRVAPGAVLMEIDGEGQRALLSSLESQRVAREADLAYARQQAGRAETLLAAGAISQQELDQSRAALQAAEAHLQALDEQIRQQQVELAYYRVTAPTSGTVGDVPVRVGDRVTRATELTTIDQNAGFEVYLNVPVQQAADLRSGLPVRLLDERGSVVSTNPITFVSPAVDPATQTVLAKTDLHERADRFRADQFVRAQVVWDTEAGLTVPVVAVNRINGRYFAFVAETGEGGLLVARQRPVDVGAIVGNDYAVRSGLEVGDRLIVSGVQRLGDGVPIQIR